MLTSTAPGLWVDPRGWGVPRKTKHLRCVHAPLLPTPIPSSASVVANTLPRLLIVSSTRPAKMEDLDKIGFVPARASQASVLDQSAETCATYLFTVSPDDRPTSGWTEKRRDEGTD